MDARHPKLKEIRTHNLRGMCDYYCYVLVICILIPKTTNICQTPALPPQPTLPPAQNTNHEDLCVCLHISSILDLCVCSLVRANAKKIDCFWLWLHFVMEKFRGCSIFIFGNDLKLEN